MNELLKIDLEIKQKISQNAEEYLELNKQLELNKREIISSLNSLISQCPYSEELSDGYHKFKELYEFRLLYNAHLFNSWHKLGKFNVHKSKKHFDGSLCFNGDYFIVIAILSSGQISNHYEMKYWDYFKIPDREQALFEFDGHTSIDVLNRLIEELILGDN